MKIKPYVDKLEKSKEFEEFNKKYPDAYLIAGFFVLDLEEGHNIHQIDFYVPSTKKVGAFTLDKGVTLQLLDPMGGKVPEKLDMKTKIDLEALPGILKDEMRNRSMSEDIKKIIAVVQNIEGKRVWNLSCVLTGMEILKSHIEDDSESVLKIEKLSMLDIIKKLPPEALGKMQNAAGMPQGMSGQPMKKDIDKQLKQLDAIAAEIDKEKKMLQNAADAKKKTPAVKKKK